MKHKMPIVIWLAALPKGVAEEAQHECLRTKEVCKYEVESLSFALLNGFDWSKSARGSRYWPDLHNTIYELGL